MTELLLLTDQTSFSVAHSSQQQKTHHNCNFHPVNWRQKCIYKARIYTDINSTFCFKKINVYSDSISCNLCRDAVLIHLINHEQRRGWFWIRTVLNESLFLFIFVKPIQSVYLLEKTTGYLSLFNILSEKKTEKNPSAHSWLVSIHVLGWSFWICQFLSIHLH